MTRRLYLLTCSASVAALDLVTFAAEYPVMTEKRHAELRYSEASSWLGENGQMHAHQTELAVIPGAAFSYSVQYLW
jgi:hypothetical protein